MSERQLRCGTSSWAVTKDTVVCVSALIVRIVQRVNPEETPWWNYVYVSFTVKSSKTNVLITMFTITFSKAWDLSASNTWCV